MMVSPFSSRSAIRLAIARPKIAAPAELGVMRGSPAEGARVAMVVSTDWMAVFQMASGKTRLYAPVTTSSPRRSGAGVPLAIRS